MELSVLENKTWGEIWSRSFFYGQKTHGGEGEKVLGDYWNSISIVVI